MRSTVGEGAVQGVSGPASTRGARRVIGLARLVEHSAARLAGDCVVDVEGVDDLVTVAHLADEALLPAHEAVEDVLDAEVQHFLQVHRQVTSLQLQ